MTAEEARNITKQTTENKLELTIAKDLIDREIKTEALLGHTSCEIQLDGADLSWYEIEYRRLYIYKYYVALGYKVKLTGYNRATELDHFVFDWK